MSIGAGRPKFNTWVTMSAGKKKNVTPGKFRGSLLGRAVLLLERYHDVRVCGAYEAGSAVHVVDRAIRQPDVVEDIVDFPRRYLLANVGLDQVTDTSRFLNAGSAFGSNMQNELAVIAAWEEVLAKPGHEQKNREADEQEGWDENGPAMHCRGEQELVRQPQSLEAPLETSLES